MALWRDPLDELIDELERAVPPEADPADCGLPSFTDFQLAVCPILFGTKEEQGRAAQDPRVQAVWAYHERLARRRQASDSLNGTADKTGAPPEPA